MRMFCSSTKFVYRIAACSVMRGSIAMENSVRPASPPPACARRSPPIVASASRRVRLLPISVPRDQTDW